jgi:two-component system sensor histidine kinase GlrK
MDNINMDAIHLKDSIFIQISLVLFLLVVLVLFTGVLITRSITRPISVLAQGVRELSRGNLNIRFNVKSKDEVGELADVFNEMVATLKEHREREQLVGKLKTEFISIAAHQLRTPLSSVKWILKMLLEDDFGKLNEKQKEFVAKGYEANDRMVMLVNDLLDASRIEEGRFGFEFKLDNLSKFFKSTVKTFEQQANIRNVKINLSLPEKPIMMVFDSQRLKMALSNLIDNATRYTNPGGEVNVLVEQGDGFVRAEVKDTGVGIPEKQKERVFSKFFRADNVIRMQTEGTGLGLYLTKNIIEKHGGNIWFKSEEGKGTSFIFTLPLTKKS